MVTKKTKAFLLSASHLLGDSTSARVIGAIIVLSSICLVAYVFHVTIGRHTPASRPISPKVLQRAEECNSLYDDGRSDLRRGHLAQAEAAFRQALALDTALDPLLYSVLAQTLEEEGRTQEALAAYAAAYTPEDIHDSNFPDHLQGLLRYARFCDQAGQWGRAVQVYGWALQNVTPPPGAPSLDVHFDPRVRQSLKLQSMVHVMQGVALSNQGKTYEALTAFRQAAQSSPDFALAQYYLGYGWQRRNHVAQARAAFTKSALLGTGDVKAAAVKALGEERV